MAVAYLLFSADLRCATRRAPPRLVQLRHGSAENADVQVLPGKEFPYARMRIYTTLATPGIFLLLHMALKIVYHTYQTA